MVLKKSAGANFNKSRTKPGIVKKKSKEKQELGLFLRSLGGWREEYIFHPKRKWRFDHAHPGQRVAVEFEGGIFRPVYCPACKAMVRRGGGFHQSIRIMLDNMAKYNEAALLGWCVLRVEPAMIRSGEAFRQIEQALKK